MPVKKNTKAETENTAEETIVDNITEEIPVKPKKEIAYTDRVIITNTRSWNLNFTSTETGRDIVVPAGAKHWSKLTVAEVEGQIQTGNFFFVGADGEGNNAYIEIEDDDIRNFVFHSDENNNGDKIILNLNSVKQLLAISNRSTFEDALEKLVVTEGDKRMIIPMAIKVGIDNVQSYKVSAIEKISGYKF